MIDLRSLTSNVLTYTSELNGWSIVPFPTYLLWHFSLHFTFLLLFSHTGLEEATSVDVAKVMLDFALDEIERTKIQRDKLHKSVINDQIEQWNVPIQNDHLHLMSDTWMIQHSLHLFRFLYVTQQPRLDWFVSVL